MHCSLSSACTPASEHGSEPSRTWARLWEARSLLIAECGPLVTATSPTPAPLGGCVFDDSFPSLVSYIVSTQRPFFAGIPE